MPRQYFFWKYLNTIIVLYCIIVQKSPNFVQLSPIQCTYSNIFIRFFKFFPANTNIYQNSYSVIRRAVRLTPGCPVITMRSPYFIRYEVFNVITMRCPYFIRYKVLCHCERKIGDPAGYFCTRGEKEYASIRQAIVACDSRLVKREAYDASPGRDTLL